MKTNIPCIVIDDDQYAIDLLCEYIKEIPGLVLTHSYTNPLVALSELKPTQIPTLVFLDIDMKRYSGLELAESLKGSNYQIIVTTGHSKYALNAWSVNAEQFLLKPIEFSVFADKVMSVTAGITHITVSQPQNFDRCLIRIGERGSLLSIQKSEIYYIQGAKNYIDIFFADHRHRIYYTLKELEVKLEADGRFFRVHNSYIINTDFLHSLEGNVIDLGKHKVNMAGKFREKFLAHLDSIILISNRIKNV